MDYRYVLLQAPEVDAETGYRQVELVKLGGTCSEGMVDRLVKQGYAHVGFVESDLTRGKLLHGLTVYQDGRISKLQNKLYKIAELVKPLYD